MFDNINFKDLKHNLYEIYKLNENCSTEEVKKKYKKLMLKFHPDKSSELEEEIFNHIIIGYKILSDNILKKKYDNFLENNNKEISDYNELKKNFQSFKNKDENYKIALNNYNNLNLELDKKHKISNDNFNVNVENKFNEIKKNRNDLNINTDDLLKPLINNFNKDLFDQRFKEIKTKQNKDLISNSSEIITYQDNKTISKYSNLEYNNLYIEDSIIDDKFCSLDNAFKLNPEIKINNYNIKSKIDEYNKMSKDLEKAHLKKK